MIDQDTVSWILEFILRQPIDDWLANAIFFALPISAPLNPHLNKMLLLRRIASELSTHRVTDRTLHTFELIEELDRDEHLTPEPSDSMRAAYCAVAVDLTVRFLKESSDEDGDFFHAVNRIWNCRVSDLERSEAAGLVSRRLREERRVMEEAVVNPIVRVDLMGRNTEKEALEAVRVYLKEAAEEMGPSFLELAAEATLENFQAGRDGKGCEGKHVGSMPGAGKDAYRKGRCSTSGFDSLPMPKVIKVKEKFKSVSSKMHNMVEEPLSNAVTNTTGTRVAEAGERSNVEIMEENHSLINGNPVRSVDKGAEVMHPRDIGSDIGHNRAPDAVLQPSLVDQNPAELKDVEKNKNRVGGNARVSSVIKGKIAINTEGTSTSIGRKCDSDAVQPPTIMDRNPTARTYEWHDDSTEPPSEKSPNLSEKLDIPNRKKREVPLIKIPGNKEFAGRRKMKKWSTHEEDTLRKAVEKCGVGNWALIKSCYSGTFEDRTAVDLKDKWRNMIR